MIIIRTYDKDLIATCIDLKTAIYMTEATLKAELQENQSHRGARIYEIDGDGNEFCVKKYFPVLPIENLDLSVRSYNVLARAGITTTEDLRNKSIADLLAIRNMNIKCLREIMLTAVYLFCPESAPKTYDKDKEELDRFYEECEIH